VSLGRACWRARRLSVAVSWGTAILLVSSVAVLGPEANVEAEAESGAESELLSVTRSTICADLGDLEDG